ncbi:MAG: MmgE/PrpD family protein [Dehalococcoidales bacterium]|nr:MmgE/PrpD family protein [Dehalococcoidales bacterium]
MATIVEKLVDFAAGLKYENLPEDVRQEAKRILLDSIGCALAAITVDKGRMVVRVAREMGGAPEANVIGTGDKVSTFAAAFANGELINALDYDVVTSPPGHAVPYVLPPVLAIAEKRGVSGKDLICAIALAHEMSARFGKAMGDVREVKPGEKIAFPPVGGYTCTIFGGTLAAGMMQGLDRKRMAYAMGIAGHIAPAQAMSKWVRVLPSSTDKYLLAGWMCQAALTSVLLAEQGYTGDVEVLEGEFGFYRYMGASKFTPDFLLDKLGEDWWLPRVTVYKPWPCCRIPQTVMDCLAHIIEANKIQPEEIEKVNAFCDPHGAVMPMWKNTKLTSSLDAQMSTPFALSLVAHGVKVGPEWQDDDTIRDEKLVRFMDKVTVEPHPDFEKVIKGEPASRIGKIEVIARGKTFSEERKYRKGSPATKETRMSDREIIEKFKHNAARILPVEAIETLPDRIMRLEKTDDVSELARLWS